MIIVCVTWCNMTSACTRICARAIIYVWAMCTRVRNIINITSSIVVVVVIFVRCAHTGSTQHYYAVELNNEKLMNEENSIAHNSVYTSPPSSMSSPFVFATAPAPTLHPHCAFAWLCVCVCVLHMLFGPTIASNSKLTYRISILVFNYRTTFFRSFFLHFTAKDQ